ncbi:MAG: helix-turn-helix domain-containing protein, partial [Anaerolineae bacterium]|nr:helix-turn-helix domain-containing protein [Anaerolineae bacterium]
WYRERLGLTTERVSPEAIRARWDVLVRYLPEFKILVPDPEPIVALLHANVYESRARTVKSPGTLTGESILVDANGRVWLTDFGDANDVPQFWDFVTLESVIRFDWVEEKELRRLQEIEEHLLDDVRFGKPETQGIESPAARQAVSFIQRIRHHAARAVGKEHLPYHLGIFFHAARRAADVDLGLIAKPLECARLAHTLLAMAMIAEKVETSERKVDVESERGLRVDSDGVKRDGKRLSVRGQSLELLRYLANPPDRLRTRREIIEKFLQEPFDEQDETQTSWLYTAIHRLRQKIEYDPDNPCFLLNESNGYRLRLQPDE